MSIQPSQAPDDSNDDFWAKERAVDAANRGRQADPSACGTCQANVKAGEQVEHDECAQRATLLKAPDHPSFELLAGVSLEENAKLPARFHIPVFDDCGVPNAWLCAVCQEDGMVSQWPCAVAVKQGTKVFTPAHGAETASQRQTSRISELEKQLAEYEVMNPQQCPAGQHLVWLVDSEHTHTCPWCRIAELEQQMSALQETSKQLLRKAASAPSQREAGAL
ncbi:hypothetical protein GTY67_13765 [Streptomyces sp. SID8374]|uniref:hypothetical protein n=1 Tax=Streptomyces sp. SID8374 TaxID=2690354 RepID=UPI00136CC544|nr:hypothetical protein [Streptomyces sp. SID8374]MYX14465.1 hypothetical protein [Streptomyces sp. SID8374]